VPDRKRSGNGTPAPHPKEAGPKPPFPKQRQGFPATETHMRPEPDHGERSYRGSGRLKDRVALITGGDSGIGRAVALAFAREGADVALSYLEAEQTDARGSAKWVEEAGRRALLFPGDIQDEAHCRTLIERTVAELGRIDILVNNAAYQWPRRHISEVSAAELERTFRTNVFAMFHLCKFAVAHMQPGSVIINVSSIQGDKPSPHLLPYAATKGAVDTFSAALAQQLADSGIRVNVVAPGPVWTPLITIGSDADEFGKDYPMGRPAQPAELAPLFVFLASDESRYVNGAVVGVTGGKPML
jgi:NAD(P)-dependent dehydrogenase (short-subunit alcohol dehydrogenase family)